MTYKDELKIKLINAGIEPTEDILRFIDNETIPLKAELFTKRGQLIEWESLRGLFNDQARADHAIGYLESQGYKLIK